MKRSIFILGAVTMAFAFASCDLPSYPGEKNIKPGEVSVSVDGETVTLDPLSVSPSASFMRGFDASACNDSGTGTYSDASGNIKDIFEVLPDFGVNWVRLRVWNNPSSGNIPTDTSGNKTVAGASDLDTVLDQAVRAKKYGLKVLLDFHYSDYWADPAKQVIPSDWLSCTTSDEMAEKVSDWTEEVLTALAEAGAAPNMIQIGNEISSGMLKHKSITIDSSNEEKATEADSSIAGTFLSANYFKYLVSGISAARSVCPNAKIMLHFTDINRGNPLTYLASFKTAFETAGVDYDVVGLSYYPEWSSHGSLSALGEKIASLKATYKKEVVVVETSAPNTIDSDSSKNFYADQYVTNLTVDGKIYEGIEQSSDGKVYASVQNQAAIIRAVMDVAVKNGALGVFTWGGEYKGDWKYGLFYGSGKPMPSLAVLKLN